MSKISTYTSKAYLETFYDLNPQYRVNSSAVVKMWRKINCEGKKRDIMNGIKPGVKLNGFEYLKEQLK